mgnify:CR=1 FL=1
MRVIVCGAGQVGTNIARYLSRFDTDVTVIDIDPALVAAITTPGYVAPLEELEALEQCFQDGLIRCDSVDQDCGLVDECSAHMDYVRQKAAEALTGW